MDLQSQSIKEIALALSKAQSEMGAVPKEGKNPHFRSKYPTLESAIESAREALTKNNISFPQSPVKIGEEYYVVTTFMHSSGEWIRNYCPLFLDKANMQGLGSAITYARRYGLLALAGLAPEDDDGNLAVKPEAEKKEPQSTTGPTSVVELGNTVIDIGKKHIGKTFKELVFNDKNEAKDLYEWISKQGANTQPTWRKFKTYMEIIHKGTL